jgi:hypothetical protein
MAVTGTGLISPGVEVTVGVGVGGTFIPWQASIIKNIKTRNSFRIMAPLL